MKNKTPGKDTTKFGIKLETTWEQQQKIELLKKRIIKTELPDSIEDCAKVFTAKYMCDIKNANNPKYKGLYKWWLRLKEKLR